MDSASLIRIPEKWHGQELHTQENYTLTRQFGKDYLRIIHFGDYRVNEAEKPRFLHLVWKSPDALRLLLFLVRHMDEHNICPCTDRMLSDGTGLDAGGIKKALWTLQYSGIVARYPDGSCRINKNLVWVPVEQFPVTKEDADAVLDGKMTCEELEASYDGFKDSYTPELLLKDAMESAGVLERSITSSLQKFARHPDIREEFCRTLMLGAYADRVRESGYTAGRIAEKEEYNSPPGVYHMLIFLRENPARAKYCLALP